MPKSMRKSSSNTTRFAADEVDEFEELYRTYSRMVRNVIYRLQGENELEDLVHETFLKVWRNREDFCHAAKSSTWIYRIATHVAIDRLRWRGRQPNRSNIRADQHGHEGHERRVEQSDLILKGLGKLGINHRTVIVLFCMEGLTLHEIADIEEVSVGTIKSRLHYARKMMQDFLRSQGVTFT